MKWTINYIPSSIRYKGNIILQFQAPHLKSVKTRPLIRKKHRVSTCRESRGDSDQKKERRWLHTAILILFIILIKFTEYKEIK
jgi:hypothetical protein